MERTSPGEKVLLMTRKDRILPTACVCFQFSLNNANSPNLFHSRRARRWSPPAGVTLTTRGASLNPPAHSDPCAWCARAQMVVAGCYGCSVLDVPYWIAHHPATRISPAGPPNVTTRCARNTNQQLLACWCRDNGSVGETRTRLLLNCRKVEARGVGMWRVRPTCDRTVETTQVA